MKFKVVFLMLLLILFTIFVTQNTEVTLIKIYFWEIYLSKIVLLIITLAIGVVLGLMIATMVNRKEKKKISEKNKIEKEKEEQKKIKDDLNKPGGNL